MIKLEAENVLKPRGTVAFAVLRGRAPQPKLAITRSIIQHALRHGLPRAGLSRSVNVYRFKNFPHLLRGLRRVALVHTLNLASFIGEVRLVKIHGWSRAHEDFGVVSLRVVTDAGVAAIVDAFDAGVGFTLSNFNYHGIGTGTNAEAAANTALQTELTTEYTGNVRATGTQSQPTAPQYRTVGTNTLDSGTPAITEHGVLSQAATGGGTLLDRSVFAAINLDGTAGDGLQSTYTLTLTSGG